MRPRHALGCLAEANTTGKGSPPPRLASVTRVAVGGKDNEENHYGSTKSLTDALSQRESIQACVSGPEGPRDTRLHVGSL